MRNLLGKVAVVTGAASGLGFGLAERFGREGMHVVMADIEEPALLQAQRQLQQQGASVLAVTTDVSREQDVESLARRTLDAFGAVHVVCNNAGVWQPASVWTMTQNDWEWLLRVNLGGVINGIRTFIPIMIG